MAYFILVLAHLEGYSIFDESRILEVGLWRGDIAYVTAVFLYTYLEDGKIRELASPTSILPSDLHVQQNSRPDVPCLWNHQTHKWDITWGCWAVRRLPYCTSTLPSLIIIGDVGLFIFRFHWYCQIMWNRKKPMSQWIISTNSEHKPFHLIKIQFGNLPQAISRLLYSYYLCYSGVVPGCSPAPVVIGLKLWVGIWYH